LEAASENFQAVVVVMEVLMERTETTRAVGYYQEVALVGEQLL
jgi:hypothetical protein